MPADLRIPVLAPQQREAAPQIAPVTVTVQEPASAPSAVTVQGATGRGGNQAPVLEQREDGTLVIENDGVRTTLSRGEDGVLRVITEEVEGEEVVAVTTQPSREFDLSELDLSRLVPEGAVTIAIAFFVAMVCMIVGLPISRAIARRMDRAPVAPPLAPEFRAELSGLQESVTSVAVEVERVAEAQRWTARQLAAQPGGVR